MTPGGRVAPHADVRTPAIADERALISVTSCVNEDRRSPHVTWLPTRPGARRRQRGARVRPTWKNDRVGGVDTLEGVGYQQAQAVLEALALLDSGHAALRVEGTDDVIDIEILDDAGDVVAAKQIKIRDHAYTWGQAELLGILQRWVGADVPAQATFEFVTDGRLGPTGEKVREALVDASDGDFTALSVLWAPPPLDKAVAVRLSRARIRIDPTGVHTLLSAAERAAVALLAGPARTADLNERASQVVAALFTLLTERAGQNGPEDRVVTREQIAGILGLDLARTAPSALPALIAEYLAAAAAVVTSNLLELRLLDNEQPEARHDPMSLLSGDRPIVLSGPTGSGKSTTLTIVRTRAAAAGKVVLLGHAESYLPGHLDLLAADALSEVVGRPVPTSVGARLLADPDVTLVIDGVSEVPTAVRDALRVDLRPRIAGGQTATILLAGRDSATVRSALPMSRPARLVHPAPLGSDGLVELLGRRIASTVDPHWRAQRIRAVLGDGADNPFLATIADELLLAGVDVVQRAALYAHFLEQLAARAGITGLVEVTLALGVVYAGLLAGERRYADPFEFRQLLQLVCARPEFVLSADEVAATARTMGLVVAQGVAQTVLPLHDSVADYLAGRAQAAGLVRPERIGAQDHERLVFAAELAGVDHELAWLVVQQQPLLTPRLARFDRAALSADAPAQIAKLLAELSGGRHRSVQLYQVQSSVIAFASEAHPTGWVTGTVGADLLSQVGSVKVLGGPLDAAVRLWKLLLTAELRPVAQSATRRPTTVEQACEALERHTLGVEEQLTPRIELLPAAARDAVRAHLGLPGIVARVRAAEPGGFQTWQVRGRRAELVDVRPDDGQDEESLFTWHAGLDSVLAQPPSATAADHVLKALADLTGVRWS